MRYAGFAFLLLVTSAYAQDDYNFGSGLAERGYFDLAKEVFDRLVNNPSTPPEKRVEGELGKLQIRVLELEREGDSARRLEMAGAVAKEIEDYISKNSSNPRTIQAYSLLTDVYQLVGKTHIANKENSKAEEAFKKAVDVCRKLIDQLRSAFESEKNEDKKRELERQKMFAEYTYITAMFYQLDAFKGDPGRTGEMEETVRKLEKFFEEFMWNYEAYLLAMDASIFMGRIYQIMAEMLAGSDVGKSENYWKKCFMWIGKGKGPAENKEYREDVEVREICLRTIYYEMVARIAYGNALRQRSGPFKKQFEDAIALGDKAFKMYPYAKTDPWGVRIQIEQAKAFFRLGEQGKAKSITNQLLQSKDQKIRDMVMSVFADLAGGMVSPKEAVDIAEESFNRQIFYVAIRQFREALASMRDPADRQKLAPRCWLRIGQIYYLLGRDFEAIAALSALEQPEFANTPEGKEAVEHKYRALRRLEKITQDKEIKEELTKFKQKMVSLGLAGDADARDIAIDLENQRKWPEADQAWQKLLASNKPKTRQEAMSRIGFCRYQMAVAAGNNPAKMQEAVNAFKEHVKFVASLPNVDPEILEDMAISVNLMIYILVKFLNKPQEALDNSKDFVERFADKIKAAHYIAVFRQRVEAWCLLRKPLEAEKDLLALQKKFEESKEGLNQYAAAVVAVAKLLDEEAKKLKDTDPEGYKAMFEKANEWRLEASKVAGSGGKDEYESTKQAAEDTFQMAESYLEKDPSEAKKKYATARGLFESLLARFAKQVAADEDEELDYKIRYRIARCLVGEGNFDDAIKRVEELLQVQKDDVDLIELKGDALYGKGLATKAAADQARLFQDAEKEYGRAAYHFGRIAKDENYYRLLFKWCLSRSRHTEGMNDLIRFFEQARARGESPDWTGAGLYKKKLNDLEEAVNQMNPKKNQK